MNINLRKVLTRYTSQRITFQQSEQTPDLFLYSTLTKEVSLPSPVQHSNSAISMPF